MKAFRWVLILTSLLVIFYPLVYLAGKITGIVTLPINNYYWIAILLGLVVMWWEEKRNRTT
jgi:hypothetical protein